MTIAYANKLGESTTVGATTVVTTGAAARAGSLIVVAYGGKAAASLTATAVADSGGNTYTRHQRASTLAAVGLAYIRLPSLLDSGSTVTVTWSSTPTVAWVSVHAFEGASGTATNTSTSTGTSTTAVSSVTVAGTDWLTVAVAGLPYDYSVAGQVGANSSTLRDNNSRTAAPWLEVASRNGTSGSTHSPGIVYGVSIDWYVVAASWPYQAMPIGGGQNTGLWAV